MNSTTRSAKKSAESAGSFHWWLLVRPLEWQAQPPKFLIHNSYFLIIQLRTALGNGTVLRSKRRGRRSRTRPSVSGPWNCRPCKIENALKKIVKTWSSFLAFSILQGNALIAVVVKPRETHYILLGSCFLAISGGRFNSIQ